MPPWPTLLGLNLWLIGLVVPLLLGRGTISTGAWLLAVPAPLALLLGLRLRRSALGPGLLLLGVPLLTLLPVADGPLAAPRLHPRPATVLLLGVLVAYLVSASAMLAARRWTETGTAAWQEGKGAKAEVSGRLLRRIATYRLLALICIAVPALFLYAVVLHPEHVRALRQLVGTPARLAGLQASLIAAVTMVFCVVFRFAVMAPLAVHLGHDRALRSRIEALRTAGRRGRPRPQLYVAMVLALSSMALLIWWSL